MDNRQTRRGRSFRALMRCLEVVNSALIFGRLLLPFLLLALANSVPVAQYEAARADLVQAQAETAEIRAVLAAWEMTRYQNSPAAEVCSTD